MSAPLLAGSKAEPEVDFHFQMLNISTPRQGGKSLNLFITRYPHSAEQCPFSAVDNNCIQYQKGMRELALNLTRDGTDGTFYPELGAEWERVNLALCRAIYAGAYGPTAQPIAAVSTLLQVNGDGRPYAKRGPTMPFEPDAHGTTCTIGDIPPVQRPNHLPNLGGLVELRASAEGVYKVNRCRSGFFTARPRRMRASPPSATVWNSHCEVPANRSTPALRPPSSSARSRRSLRGSCPG